MKPLPVPRPLRALLIPARLRLVQFRLALGIALICGLAALVGEWVGARGLNTEASLLYLSAMFAILYFRRKNAHWDADFQETAARVGESSQTLEEKIQAARNQLPSQSDGQYSFLQRRLFRDLYYDSLTHPWKIKNIETKSFAANLAALAMVACLIWTVQSRPEAGPTVAKATESTEEKVRVVINDIQVTPGDQEIEAGSNLAIIAEFPEDQAPSTADLVLIDPETKAETRTPMIRNLEDPTFGQTIRGALSDFDYYVSAPEIESSKFQVSVFETPRLLRADASLEFPEYTEWKPRVIEDTRRISAVEGSRLTLDLYLNKEVESAKWTRQDILDERLLEPTNENATHYRLEWTLSQSETFRLALTDSDGRTNKEPIDFSVQVTPNDLPSIQLTAPAGDSDVSPIEEVRFAAKFSDDWGVQDYGFGYTLPGGDPVETTLGNGIKADITEEASLWLELEPLGVAPNDLISFYFWAEDVGPNAETRRTESDLFFATVRPFDQIFRETAAQSGQQSQQDSQAGGQGGQGPQSEPLQLQQDILTATWNLRPRVLNQRNPEKIREDTETILSSQDSLDAMLTEARSQSSAPESVELFDQAIEAGKSTSESLNELLSELTPKSLNDAVRSGRAGLEALNQLNEDEFNVSESQNQNQSQGGGQSRSQRQLNNLEMSRTEDLYETESQASEGGDNAQDSVVDKLQELARRQEDFNERLQELQTALEAAEAEEERERIERELKRLREEQRRMAQDLDAVEQDMASSQTESQQAREEIQEARDRMRESEAALDEGEVSQALAQGERASRALESLRDSARDAASSQFADDIRNLVNQARELSEAQDQIDANLKNADDAPTPNRLTGSDEENQVVEDLEAQQEKLDTFLQDLKALTEASEPVEPLLSNQLYETLRQASQNDPAPALDSATDMARRGFFPMADQFEDIAAKGIDALENGVSRAAESILGNETEGLRRAREELADLLNEAREDLRANSDELEAAENGAPGPGGSGSEEAEANESSEIASGANPTESTEQPPNESTEQAANSPAGGASQEPSDSPSPGGAPEESNDEEESVASANGGSGSPQEAPQDQPGQGSRRTRPPEGSESEEPQTAQSNGAPGGGGASGRPDDAQQSPDNPIPFYELDSFQEGPENANRPFSGSGFVQWADRLRDVEDMVFDQDIGDRIARLEEESRELRAEARRHGEAPQWDLLQLNVIHPMEEVISEIQREIARRDNNETMVPVDRDPVPDEFRGVVQDYYERLSKRNRLTDSSANPSATE